MSASSGNIDIATGAEGMSRETWTFQSAGHLLFGRNAVRQIGAVAATLRAKRAVTITDPHLERLGLHTFVNDSLRASGIECATFTGGEPEPSLAAALACIEFARGAQPDVIIGLGGGSNMDLAKITAMVLAHGGSPRDYVGEDRVPGPTLPMIGVPTTAGTGSEVSCAAVFTDTESHLKVGILSQHLRPRAALVDPLLTVGCPPKVTADSGIDALTHAIEAYTAVDNVDFPLREGQRSVYQGRNAFGDLFAERAIVLIGQYLRRAVADGRDLEARDGMALAATMAGLAFSNVGVAAVHALEYPVGVATHCSHGAGNGLLLPYVMRFNQSVRRDTFAKIARLLGEDTSGLSDGEAAQLAIVAVERLRDAIGVPARLRELGARPEQLRDFAEKAAGITRVLRVNPRMPTVDDLESILRSAW